MNTSHKILLVDDDPNLLEACRRRLGRQFQLETQAGPELGLDALARRGPFAIVVSDMRMPGMDGVQFLSKVRKEAPETVRIMLTGCIDLQTAIDAVNEGHIFRFLTKPCSPENLVQTLEAGLEQYRLVESQKELIEMKLRHAQKMELVGQCAAGAVHDLRNILAIIELQAHLALEQESPHSRQAQALTQIHTAAANAANLMQQMVTFSRRQEQVQFGQVDGSLLLTQLSDLLRHILSKRISLQCHCPAGLPPIHGNAGMLSQVILNLVINARDAMPDGGTITLDVEAAPGEAPSPAPAGSLAPDQHVCLSVTDTGCGMDATVQKRILEPFFTTKAEGKGTGLGLAVVADIVQQHLGRLEVLSEIGRGSTFRVHLPVSRESTLQSN